MSALTEEIAALKEELSKMKKAQSLQLEAAKTSKTDVLTLAIKKWGYENPISVPSDVVKRRDTYQRVPDAFMDFRNATSEALLFQTVSPYLYEETFDLKTNPNMYGESDQRVLYALMRHWKPKKVIEVRNVHCRVMVRFLWCHSFQYVVAELHVWCAA